MTGRRTKSLTAICAFAALVLLSPGVGGRGSLFPHARIAAAVEEVIPRVARMFAAAAEEEEEDVDPRVHLPGTNRRRRKRKRKHARIHARKGGNTEHAKGLGRFLDPKTEKKKRVSLRSGGSDNGPVPPAPVPPARDLPFDAAVLDPGPTLAYVPLQIPPYTIENVLLALPFFSTKFFVFLYVAERDEFVVLYGKEHKFGKGESRIITDGHVLSFALRNNFPERFLGKGKSSDLAFLASVSDNVHFAAAQCLNPKHRDWCQVDHYAPILVFGSAFADQSMLPSQISMPMPPNPNLPCFSHWQLWHEVCPSLRPRKGDSGDGLIFEEHVGVGWDDLIPTIIWRGTDFKFLHQMFNKIRQPVYEQDVEPKIDKYGDDPAGIIRALHDVWDELLPRWKGVVFTAEAELEASERNDGSVPWADIKFASTIINRQKIPCEQSPVYQAWNDRGIPSFGPSVNLDGHARYKYHIDLGGGGGTTWTGTINKLSMPGVLFHHVTPTKDWIHDHLEPWVHYIPVAMDLSDLRQKYEWAEANPREARKISDNATKFTRWIGTPEGFEEIYRKYFVDNLGAIIDAYQPIQPPIAMKEDGRFQSTRKENDGRGGAALDILPAIFASQPNLTEVVRCTGLKRSSCKFVDYTSPKQTSKKVKVRK